MTEENQYVESDEKGFIPKPGNEDEGKVDAVDAAPLPIEAAVADESDAPAPVYAGPSSDYDDEDVSVALERETQDGSGFTDESELPAEDFDGFAEPDVEDESE